MYAPFTSGKTIHNTMPVTLTNNTKANVNKAQAINYTYDMLTFFPRTHN